MGGLTGRSVLAVEDEPLLAMLLEEQLAEAGARVIGPSTTPAEALACLAREQPDAAVLDRNLAGEDSLPVASELIRRGIPFMVTTGSGTAGLPAELAAAAILGKPYEPAALIAGLERLLG